MTGRRLYDLLCDGWKAQGEWARKYGDIQLPQIPHAWPFLTDGERRAFSHAAARIKPVKR